MVCTYFLLANIVVFGFGRKNKHVMPDVSKQKMKLKAEYNFYLFLPLWKSWSCIYSEIQCTIPNGLENLL